MKTRKYLALLFLVFISLSSFAQRHEIGFAAGGLTYTGELSPGINAGFYRQSLYGFYKTNFTPAFGLKFSLLEGEFYANDDASEDPLPLFRNAETSSLIVEFSAVGEYNFFDFRKDKSRRRLTPYLTGGIAFYVYSQDALNSLKTSSDGTGFAIPFGVGLKYQLSRVVNIGMEFVARKTFNDMLDGVSDTKRDGLQLGDPYSDDWYYFTGIFISYTFYGVDCPAHFK